MTNKKKILVVFTGALELGGIERGLLGFLDAVDYRRYDVDLFLYGHHGSLFPYIDPRANLLPEVHELAYLKEPFAAKLRHGCFLSASLRLRDGIKSRFGAVDYEQTWKYIVDRCAPPLDTEYDMALGFFRPFDYIDRKVNAKVKIGWVCTDYSKAHVNPQILLRDYSRLDHIAAVSEETARIFCEVVPELGKRVFTVKRTLPIGLIQRQAEEPITEHDLFSDASTKLLSIGRFCEAKNFDSVPEICKLLRKDGLDVTWFLIGYGADEALIRRRIAEAGMEKHVIILGKKENPYPYIKACDLYVQPSRFEGRSVSVLEAQALHKPVVITNYATSGSQLRDGYDGVVVPMDNEGCARGIAAVLRNRELRERLIENMKGEDYTNAGELEKLYRLVE